MPFVVSRLSCAINTLLTFNNTEFPKSACTILRIRQYYYIIEAPF